MEFNPNLNEFIGWASKNPQRKVKVEIEDGNKTYDTGISKWKHNHPTDYKMGIPRHKLLGPCPICGSPTFDYGGGWRCCAPYCFNSEGNPISNLGPEPDWWNTNINVQKDGNDWCAFYDGFINLQESEAAFGDTPCEAVTNLRKHQIK